MRDMMLKIYVYLHYKYLFQREIPNSMLIDMAEKILYELILYFIIYLLIIIICPPIILLIALMVMFNLIINVLIIFILLSRLIF